MSEISKKANFDKIRYSQVWEDADILLKAMNIKEEGTYIGIASAGDNLFAMLSQNPKAVVGIDLNVTQLHLVELKMAAFKALTYPTMLAFLGAHPSHKRHHYYEQCRHYLSNKSRIYWDAHKQDIENGVLHIGKFEKYFKLFRETVLPFVHSKTCIEKLLQSKNGEERTHFFNKKWNTLRWKLMFKLFFSKWFMGKMGRDPQFFTYVKQSTSKRIAEHTAYALKILDPSKNSYLHWILKGYYEDVLPFYLREENFKTIIANFDKLTLHHGSIEEYLDKNSQKISGYNLSDIFEYMDEKSYEKLLTKLTSHATVEARLVYWNMMVPRRRPSSMKYKLKSLHNLSVELHNEDHTFFYRDFVIEEVLTW
jgi:S-adenosylmethionine-diacylglycerol 3-amino-3-carboxypropyl transferase